MCLMDHKLSGLKPVSFDHFIQNSFLEVHMHKLVRHPPHVESFEGYTKQSSEDSSSILPSANGPHHRYGKWPI